MDRSRAFEVLNRIPATKALRPAFAHQLRRAFCMNASMDSTSEIACAVEQPEQMPAERIFQFDSVVPGAFGSWESRAGAGLRRKVLDKRNRVSHAREASQARLYDGF